MNIKLNTAAQDFIRWCNDNGGFISVLLFAATVLLAWIGGVFKFLRQKPRFVMRLLRGPSFACTYSTGEKFGEYDVTRTSFALYLSISNRGSAAATIVSAKLGYKWCLNKLGWDFVRYVLGWCWLPTTISVTDFHYVLKSGGAKFYPFLMQRSTILPGEGDLYLPVGRNAHGVIYFEQPNAWGAAQPRVINDRTRVKVCIIDSFGQTHAEKFWLPVVTLEEARKYNPAIGTTHDEI